MKVYAFEAADWPEAEGHGLTQTQVLAAVRRGAHAARQLLPTLSEHINIAVRPYFQAIIPEYGTGGYTHDTEFVELWLDKTVPHGAAKTLKNLRQMTFHETCHAARWNTEGFRYDARIIEGAVFEGLATVFEREHGGSYDPLYGKYEDDKMMRLWLAELWAADTSNRDELFFTHPDGRRWVGYKTGAWLVDRAVERSGKSVVELNGLPADDILALAGVK